MLWSISECPFKGNEVVFWFVFFFFTSVTSSGTSPYFSLSIICWQLCLLHRAPCLNCFRVSQIISAPTSSLLNLFWWVIHFHILTHHFYFFLGLFFVAQIHSSEYPLCKICEFITGRLGSNKYIYIILLSTLTMNRQLSVMSRHRKKSCGWLLMRMLMCSSWTDLWTLHCIYSLPSSTLQ